MMPRPTTAWGWSAAPPRIGGATSAWWATPPIPARRSASGRSEEQTCALPILIVLDDASTDDSVGVVRRTAEDWGRDIRLVGNATNSGSPFRQWQIGRADVCSSDLDRAR